MPHTCFLLIRHQGPSALDRRFRIYIYFSSERERDFNISQVIVTSVER